MKGNVNRRTLYLVLLSLLLLTFVIAFSFFLLIPKGKEYRTLRLENKKEEKLLLAAREHYDAVEEKKKKMEETHQKIIKGFKSNFNPEKFARLHAHEFHDLYLSEIASSDQNGSFKVYEVNATTKISSPQTFYHFLDKVNQADWIIGVDFPIHFEREGDLIKSSFTMKVHHTVEASEEMKESEAVEKKDHSDALNTHHDVKIPSHAH